VHGALRYFEQGVSNTGGVFHGRHQDGQDLEIALVELIAVALD
jgi:hypothetical protein